MPLIVTQGMGADDAPEREYLVREGITLDIEDTTIDLNIDDSEISLDIGSTEIDIYLDEEMSLETENEITIDI